MNTLLEIAFFLIFLLFGNLSFGQSSEWSDFKITVEFDHDIPIGDVAVYYYRKPGNSFDRIGIKRDSASNQITISGQHSYITRVSFTTLVFAISERTVDAQTGDSIDLTTQFFLFTEELESFDEERIDLKTIEFSKDKPCVLINGIKRPDQYSIIQTDAYGLQTDTRFSHVFLGNELVKIYDL